MMASVGAVIQHFVQFPGFEGVPKERPIYRSEDVKYV